MGDNFVNIMDAALGRSKPQIYKGIIWIDKFGIWKLLDGDDTLFDEDIFCETDFKENLTNTKDLPIYSGMYLTHIVIHSYQSNNFDDPVEWDMNINVSDWKLLDTSITEELK
jgi:hypothetical protein